MISIEEFEDRFRKKLDSMSREERIKYLSDLGFSLVDENDYINSKKSHMRRVSIVKKRKIPSDKLRRKILLSLK